MSRAQELITYFGMKPLPVEGTYFINTYISQSKTAAGGPAGTAGLGLYQSDPVSASTTHVWNLMRSGIFMKEIQLPCMNSIAMAQLAQSPWVEISPLAK